MAEISRMEICDIQEADYADLSSFLCAFEGEKRGDAFWRDRFKLWWDNNPAFARSHCRGWILRDNERVVGFLGNTPCLFRVGGQDIVTFSCTGWRVMKEYRNHSLSLLLRQIDAAKNSLLFSGTTAAGLYKMFEVLRFDLIPRGGSRETKMIVLNTKNVLRRRWPNLFFVDGVAALLGPCLQLFQGLVLMEGKRKAVGKVRRLSHADESFDELWERTKDIHATNVRNANTLNWYCFEGNTLEKYLLGYYEGDQLQGYVVFGTIPWNDLKLFECFDIWLGPGKGHVLKLLIRAAKDHAEKTHCALMRIRTPQTSMGKWLSKLLPMKWSGTHMKVGSEFSLKDELTCGYFYSQGDYGL